MKNKTFILLLASSLFFLQGAAADSKTMRLTGRGAEIVYQNLSQVIAERNSLTKIASISLIQQYFRPGPFSYIMTYADQADRSQVYRVEFPEQMRTDLESLFENLSLGGKGLSVEGNAPHYTQTIVTAVATCTKPAERNTTCVLKQE